MSGDTDLIKLYSARILQLAADIPHTERLADADATVKRRSPLCGSTVTVDVAIKDGRIAAFGQDVKACALGQAAAAVIGHGAVGATKDQIEMARDQLRDMLKSDGPAPQAPFADLAVLEPARAYKNRHASILLAAEATADAFHEAENPSAISGST